jgi:hypothetical protein
MGVDIAIYAAMAATAAAAASAYVSYEGQRQQSKMGRIQSAANADAAKLQAELTRTQRASLTNQTEISHIASLEQETERRRRAQGIDDNNQVMAAFAGYDADLSGSVVTLAAENRRIMSQDIGAIRLGGQSQRIGLLGQSAGAAGQEYGLDTRQRISGMEGDAYAAMGANAWIRPTASLIGTAGSLYSSGAFSGSGVAKSPSSTPSAFGSIQPAGS